MTKVSQIFSQFSNIKRCGTFPLPSFQALNAPPTAGAAHGAARQAGGRHREVHRGRAGGGGEAGAAGAPGQQGVARGARHQLQDLPRQQTLVQREGSATLDIVKYYYYLWKMWHNTTDQLLEIPIRA